MQKFFILVAVTMVTLVSCTKLEDTAPPRKITFETAAYRPQTKAGEVTIMNEFQNFNCMAFLHAAGYETETQNFFGDDGEIIYAYDGDNSIVTTTGSVAYWAPSHDYYWPKAQSSYINFVAWYDENGDAPETISEEELIWENYTVAYNDNLLYADEAWRFNGNPNSIYHLDGEENNGQAYKAVPILFHHALAKLCFKVAVTKTSQENLTGGRDKGNTTWDVTVSNISLAGVYDTGTLALTNSDPDPNSATTRAWTGSWNTNGQTKKSIDMTAVTTPLTTTPVDVLEMQSVLPQAVTSDMILSFDYNIVTKFNNVEYSHEIVHADIALSSFSGTISNWEMNKKITYTINIIPETSLVRIDPAMVDWMTGGGSASH